MQRRVSQVKRRRLPARAKGWLLGAASLAVACAVQAGGANTQRELNPAGGQQPQGADGLRWAIGSNSQIQVWLNGQGQVYGPNNTPSSGSIYNSVFLRVDRGSDAQTRVYHNSNANTDVGYQFTQVSQSAVSGAGTSASPWAVTTVLKPAEAVDAGITLTIRDEYVAPELWLKRRLSLSGLPASGASVKLYQNIDTYLLGDDEGPGIVRTAAWNTTGVPDLVGVTRNAQFEALWHTPGSNTPLWDRYFSGRYTYPGNQICSGTDNGTSCKTGTGDLSNQIDTNTATDNGIAVQWNVPAGAPQFEVEYMISFAQSAVDLTKAFAPAVINAGQVSKLTFNINNRTTSAVNGIGFTDNLPAGVKVAATPNVQTNCPAGGAMGALPAGMTVNAAAGAGSIVVGGASVAAAASAGAESTCQVAVDVTSDVPGSHTNGTANITNLSNVANFVGSQVLRVNGAAAAIDAVDDAGAATAAGGVAVANVLVNDTVNGTPAALGAVTLSLVSSSNPGLTLDVATGAVQAAAGLPVGAHTLQYRICATGGSPCDTATVTVTIGSAGPTNIVAQPDQVRVFEGATGVVLPSVLANDTLGGNPVQLAQVVLTQRSSSHPDLSLDPATGSVRMASPLGVGSYTLVYRVCHALAPNCAEATVTVVVASLIVGPSTTPVPVNAPLGLLLLASALAFLGVRRMR
ncbi:hypothetical protein [Vandammella animalimorsus]|uniref:DUF7933 domain-containing protein n=1 Tax=Vandammella animalimorsus TaxID=2029117 RepID=UPI001178C3B5|nr:hypothetical protein [Vandammella animalimorsus]